MTDDELRAIRERHDRDEYDGAARDRERLLAYVDALRADLASEAAHGERAHKDAVEAFQENHRLRARLAAAELVVEAAREAQQEHRHAKAYELDACPLCRALKTYDVERWR